MGFGHRRHFYALAELARLEARIAFKTLLSHLSDIELDAASSDFGHLPGFAARGYRRVVLCLRKTLQVFSRG
jgi:cytochrome P450